MEYISPRDFIRKLTCNYLKYISFSILFFIGFYIYFLRFLDIGMLFEPPLAPWVLSMYLGFWAFPVYGFLKLNKDRKQELGLYARPRLEVYPLQEAYLVKFRTITFWFVLAILAFCCTNHTPMSLPFWLILIIIALEKNSIFRLAKFFNFKSNVAYETFLENQWLV
jgi:hypothetical protein